MEDIENRVAVVTGAASGIGLGITQALVAEGVNVAMVDIEAAPLDAACADLGDANVDITTHVTDVADRTAMAALGSAVVDH